MGWLKRMIAWAVAGDELAELDRWRVEAHQVRRWMAEFPDVCTAVDHLESFAYGRPYRGLTEVREGMRNRRNAGAGPLTSAMRDWALATLSGVDLDRLATIPVMNDAQIAEFRRQWRGSLNPPSCGEQYRAQLVPATDWDVAAQS